MFVPNEGDGRTFAEMSALEKHRLSHRGRAFRALAAQLQLARKQKIQITLRDADSKIRAVIQRSLSDHIYQLLRVWREAGAWEAERPKAALFRKSSRDVPASVLELGRRTGQDETAHQAS